jgi:PBP1b-binding outer membrane lipoprotein LpoB
MKIRMVAIVGMAALFLVGCNATMQQRVLDSGDQTQLQKRSYQSRFFETADKEKVMRGVISTLQDLSFVIERADMMLGTISGTKFYRGSTIKMTVSVRPRGTTQMSVRANGQFNIRPIEDPQAYQDFFTSLEKSLFLTAQLGE